MSDQDAPPANDRRLGTVERAYELARSGWFTRVDDIRQRLTREGHDAVQQHLSGPTIRRELLQLCRAARSDTD